MSHDVETLGLLSAFCTDVHVHLSRGTNPFCSPGFYLRFWLKVKVKVAQSCDLNPKSSISVIPWTTVHGILQARTLEWVVVPFSRGSSQPKDRTQVSLTAGGFFTS